MKTLKEKPLMQWLGLFGIVSLLSYAAAVIFSPLAYPGYNWLTQAVSDLSANNAPSKILWTQLNSLYGPCGLIMLTSACIFIQGKLNKLLRLGIYLFAAMNLVSSVGYGMFPLSDSGFAGAFQDVMHGFVVTPLVIGLSVASLVLIILGGFNKNEYKSLAICAIIALILMLLGPIGVALAPKSIFGVVERFSVFSAAGFNAVLGIYLFLGFQKKVVNTTQNEAQTTE